MRHLRQAWAASTRSGGRFVHTYLSPDPDEAYRALVALSRGHKQAAGHYEPTEYDRARLHDLVANGGFSHHPTHGAAPSTGFMASYHAPEGSGIARTHDLAGLAPEHIASHRKAISRHLSRPDSYQGGWLDHADNRVYLDASRHFGDEGEVRDFALHEKQKAYYDLGKGEETFLHPRLDPQAMTDQDAWQKHYARHGEEPPAEYKSYSHLYPVTNEQHEFWRKRGIHLASRDGKPAWLAGHPVGPWMNDPGMQEAITLRKEEWGW